LILEINLPIKMVWLWPEGKLGKGGKYYEDRYAFSCPWQWKRYK